MGDKEPAVLVLPNWDSNYQSWFSEHDSTAGDGFEYVYGDTNEVVGLRVDGGNYFR